MPGDPAVYVVSPARSHIHTRTRCCRLAGCRSTIIRSACRPPGWRQRLLVALVVLTEQRDGSLMALMEHNTSIRHPGELRSVNITRPESVHTSRLQHQRHYTRNRPVRQSVCPSCRPAGIEKMQAGVSPSLDRKSTRLNSSHRL